MYVSFLRRPLLLLVRAETLKVPRLRRRGVTFEGRQVELQNLQVGEVCGLSQKDSSPGSSGAMVTRSSNLGLTQWFALSRHCHPVHLGA